VSMTRNSRGIVVMMLVLLAAAPYGCASRHQPGVVDRNAAITAYLTCTGSPAVGGDSVSIGPRGGTVRVAGHELAAPKRAFAEDRYMLAQPVQGSVVGMHVIRRGPPQQPAHPVLVRISLQGCTEQQINARDWDIWRSDQPPNPGSPHTGDRLVTGRSGNELWAISPANSWFIVAD
jgi:hypothetical protein